MEILKTMKNYIEAILVILIMIPFLGKAQSSTLQKKNTAIIKVVLEDAKTTDTLMLMYFKDNLFNEPSQNGAFIEMFSTLSAGTYQFKIPIDDETGYFFLAKKMQSRFRFDQLSVLLKPLAGDSVTLRIINKDRKGRNLNTKFRYSSSGIGSLKYNIRFKADSIMYWTKYNYVPFFNESFQYEPDNNFRHPINVALNFLDLNISRIETYPFQLLKADLTFTKIGIFEILIEKYKKLTVNEAEIFKDNYLTSIGKVDLGHFSPKVLINSRSAINYFLAQAQATIQITGKADDPNALYDYLCGHYSGLVLDKLLVYYFVRTNIPLSFSTIQFQDAIKRVKTPSCLEKLHRLNKRFQTFGLGKKYNLTGINGKQVTLSDFKGKVVLVDFWFTGCGFCSKYVKEQLIKVEEAFIENPNVVFISISIDRDKVTWLKNIKEYSLTSSINLYSSGFGSSHPLIKNLDIQGYPTVMLLDKSGKVVAFGVANETTNPKLYKNNTLIDTIEKLL